VRAQSAERRVQNAERGARAGVVVTYHSTSDEPGMGQRQAARVGLDEACRLAQGVLAAAERARREDAEAEAKAAMEGDG